MRTVIFDLDGVLVRTDQAHDKAWRALAVRLGIPFDGRAAARLRGVSRMEALDIVLEGCGRSFTPAEKEALAAEKNERYRALIAEMTPADVAPDTTVSSRPCGSVGFCWRWPAPAKMPASFWSAPA